jgi:hypothetical protein
MLPCVRQSKMQFYLSIRAKGVALKVRLRGELEELFKEFLHLGGSFRTRF